MKQICFLLMTIASCLCFVFSFTHQASAQGKVNLDGGPLKEADFFVKPPGTVDEDHSGYNTWISKWYGPDGNYTIGSFGFEFYGKRPKQYNN